MKYKVFTQSWSENDIGERTEGPRICRGTFDSKDEALRVSLQYANTQTNHGVVTWMEECES